MNRRAEAVGEQPAALGTALARLLLPLAEDVRRLDRTLEVVEQIVAGAIDGMADAVESIEDNPLTRLARIDDDLRSFREDVEDLADHARQVDDDLILVQDSLTEMVG